MKWGKAAFACLQSRLFGSWIALLTAAGLDADGGQLLPKWNKESIIFELRFAVARG